MIRQANFHDLDRCVDLCVEFFSEMLANGGIEVIRKDVEKVAIKSIQEEKILVIDHDGEVQGMVAWEIVPHPANLKAKICYETIWCVDSKFKTDTLLLLRALERIAEEQADILIMANLSDKNETQMKRILTKRGYRFLESHYSKQTSCEVYSCRG